MESGCERVGRKPGLRSIELGGRHAAYRSATLRLFQLNTHAMQRAKFCRRQGYARMFRPVGIKREDRQEITVSAVIEMYVDQYVAVRQKARTQLETKRHLLVHWRDQHERPIHHLSQRDIAAGLARIAKDNGPIAANRARSAISGLFVWAMRQGLVDQNPVSAYSTTFLGEVENSGTHRPRDCLGLAKHD